MTAITPAPAGSAETRLDAAADERLGSFEASLAETAWDASNIPEEYLPVLAWAHSLDEWNPAWDAQTRRDAINGATAAHRLKGTPAGVKGVLDRIGAEYTYSERIGGAASTAAVTILNSGSLRISDAVSLESLINAHKRGTVHMTITLQSGVRGEIPIAGGLGVAVIARLDLDARV